MVLSPSATSWGVVPRVSVITTAYNAGSYLGECVESVARQSFSDWEHVIVDDGSDDKVEAVLAPVFHDRIRLARPGRMGHEAAMNLAIREASGELLAVLDADDLALPNRIGSQAELLDAHSGIALVGSRVKVLCDGAGVELRSMDLGVETSQDARRALLRGRAATEHSSVMMRRTFVDGAGGYDAQLIRGPM